MRIIAPAAPSGGLGLRPPEQPTVLPNPVVWPTASRLSATNRWNHWQARWGVRRGEHRIAPGLYAVGHPMTKSPVCVTSNYTLSFDALRSALAGRDAYILVLDTQGVNVWCAAGKGTFGTDELVRRIERTGLALVVDHRTLMLPQLGASGVAAHVVRQRSGFRVQYGPIRAADLPAYLDAGVATPAMRRVTFTLTERAVLVPVELVHTLLPMLGGAVVLYLLAGIWGAVGTLAAVLAGVVLFPLLLPWIPTTDFSSKGLLLGLIAVLPAALAAYSQGGNLSDWLRLTRSLGLLLGLPAVTAYLALNFTGSTPFTSPSGVKREMYRYLRPMATLAALGLILIIASAVGRWLGG